MNLSADITRKGGIALVLAAAALMGCARKVQIEVPASFHGRVHVVCGNLISDHPGILRIDDSGVLTGNTCPARQADVVVTRIGTNQPVDTNVLWMTTGDGLVREIVFEVP